MTALGVWLGLDRAGTLLSGRRPGELAFTRAADGPALTVADAGRSDAWPRPFARAWFENLLPEEERRSTAEAEYGVDRGDTFGLLAAIGWECAGAVSVLPEGKLPADGSYLPLTDADVWERLDALPRRVAEVDRLTRLSLGGAQDKLLLALRGDGWNLPLDGALSTHIFKPEPTRFPGLAVAEAWSLRAASAVTPTAAAELLAPPGHRPSLVVERYDRVLSGDSIQRTHQEDLCQLLGLAPASKYPSSDRPDQASLWRLADILVARALDPPRELKRLLEQAVVSVAVGDTDAHAKNYSVVHAGDGTITVSPLYDVVPALHFLPTQRRLALPMAGKWRIDEIELRHLLAEARSWGMPEALARATIDEALVAFQRGMTEADLAVPGLPGELRDTVQRQVERLAASGY